MSNLKSALLVVATLAASGAVFPLSSSALTTTFTDQTTFLSNLTPGFYLEGFNSLSTIGTTASPLTTFSSNGFSYIASVPSGGSFFGANAFGSPAVSLNTATDTILITFNSGNVTAVGGNIFASDAFGTETAGNVTATLNDGTTLTFATTLVAPGPFRGFTSDTPITSLSIITSTTQTTAPFIWPTLDNFYVGTAATPPVPFEFSPALGLTVLGGLWGVNKLRKKIKAK